MASTLVYKGALKGHNGWVSSIAVSADGKTIVTGSRDKKLIIWDTTGDVTSAGHAVKSLTGHNGIVSDVVVSSCGNFAVSASWDNTLRLWDLKNGTSSCTFKGHTNGVLSVAFSPDNRQIVSSSFDKTIRVWNTIGDCRFTLNDANQHGDSIPCVRFSPSAKSPVIFSAGWDNCVKLWDAETNSIKHTLAGHTGPVHSVTVSPDGTLCASGGRDGQAILWDVTNAQIFYSLEINSTINALAFSPRNYWLCAATDDSIQIWDLEHKKPKCIIRKNDLLDEDAEKPKRKVTDLPWIISAAWSADGSKLFAGTTSNEVLVFNVNDF